MGLIIPKAFTYTSYLRYMKGFGLEERTCFNSYLEWVSSLPIVPTNKFSIIPNEERCEY